MRYLSAWELRRCLPMELAIQAMEQAFGDDIEIPPRTLLGVSLFMAGRVGAFTGVKVVSTVAGDPAGMVVAFGGDGHPIGVVDGPALTAIRTAAGAGLATRLLARDDARVMAMLGAGTMAFDQVEAVRAVRHIDEVLVWSRTLGHARRLAERVGGEAVESTAAAVHRADVITTATPARQPLFPPEALQPGAHLNAIGAFTPEMAEIPPQVVRRARVVVDDRQAAAAEAGDLLQAHRPPDLIMGDLLAGRAPGREASEQVTLFKSVGIASQDVAAAVAALGRAEEIGAGQVL
ncbi:MAG: ornithine cyclodeaminase family protein [Actinomycetota bacterium]|nr:ornithine cyclodeaminase family protein [Actinomycetota bacterium]